jgi:hypothetical protein
MISAVEKPHMTIKAHDVRTKAHDIRENRSHKENYTITSAYKINGQIIKHGQVLFICKCRKTQKPD